MCIPIDGIHLDSLMADCSWFRIDLRLTIDSLRAQEKPVYLHTIFKVLLENPQVAEPLLSKLKGDSEDTDEMKAMLEYAIPRTSPYRSKGEKYMLAWISREKIRHIREKSVNTVPLTNEVPSVQENALIQRISARIS
jgi:hypothetical protein